MLTQGQIYRRNALDDALKEAYRCGAPERALAILREAEPYGAALPDGDDRKVCFAKKIQCYVNYLKELERDRRLALPDKKAWSEPGHVQRRASEAVEVEEAELIEEAKRRSLLPPCAVPHRAAIDARLVAACSAEAEAALRHKGLCPLTTPPNVHDSAYTDV